MDWAGRCSPHDELLASPVGGGRSSPEAKRSQVLLVQFILAGIEHNPNPILFLLIARYEEANNAQFAGPRAPHWRNDGVDIGLANLSLASLASLLSPIPRGTSRRYSSYTSFPPRNILLLPRIRHYFHLHWCCPHGRHRNCFPLCNFAGTLVVFFASAPSAGYDGA